MTDRFAPLREALGSFTFGEVLGRGAWGVVVAARHRHLERDVAVKVLPEELTRDPAVRRRFVREARLLASLDHPHIVRIYDYVETEDVCALIMERLRGGTIGDRIRLGSLSRMPACALGVAALHGLEHAHQHDVLHRDIKPENLMLSDSGVLKVTDFGIGILLGEGAERLTVAGSALGTPAYMAPEQLDESAPVGPSTDIWAAGAVLYEMLSGTVPYPARETLQASLLARVRDEPRPLQQVAPDLPPAIAETVMQALAREPRDRFGSSGEFALALDQAGMSTWGPGWLASTSVPVHPAARKAAGPSETAATPFPDAVTSSAGAETRPHHGSRARQVVAIVGAAAVVAAIAVGASVARGDGGDEPSSNDTTGAQPTSTSEPGPDTSTIEAPPRPSDLPAPPTGWPSTLPVGVFLTGPFADDVGAALGEGIGQAHYFSGDPLRPSTSWSAGSDQAALDLVQGLADRGVRPSVGYYVLRQLGRPPGISADPEQLLRTLVSRALMTAYWRDVREILQQVGRSGLDLPFVVEPSVFALVESAIAPEVDAATVAAQVAATGVPGLAGLPDTFAGFSQAWVALRDELAPSVQLGFPVDQYGPGDYLIPRRPSLDEIDGWTAGFGDFYASLGAPFDYLGVTAAYGSAGKLDALDSSVSHLATPADFERLRRFVGGLVAATDTPAVLDDLPFGNTVKDVMNDTDYHWRDNRVGFFLGDRTYEQLRSFRDVGVIGLGFAVGSPLADGSCPCDAAGDGGDDDGGYFAEQWAAYVAAGGMAL